MKQRVAIARVGDDRAPGPDQEARPRSLDVTMSPRFNELEREVLALIRDESLRVAREG